MNLIIKISNMTGRLLMVVLCIVCLACSSNTQDRSKVKSEKQEKTIEQTKTSFTNSKGVVIEKVNKPIDEWKAELSKKEFYVLREKGTERAFTGDLLNNKESGIYTCRGCGLPLFESSTKYKSGTGWPSFYQPIDSAYILEDVDYHLGYARTEVMCNRCEGHLGHVFGDGPQPTGLRYCINAVSLDFVPEKEAKEIKVKY